MTGLMGGLHAWIGYTLIHGAGLAGPWQAALYALLAALFLSIPAGFAAGRAERTPAAMALVWVSRIWMGLFGLLLSALVGAEVLRLVLRIFRGPTPWTPDWSAAVLAIACAAAVIGFISARGRPNVVRKTVPIQGLGEGLRGARVVQISDIHIGETLDGRFLRRLVDQVNALEPDIVAVTGDLVEGFVHSTRDQLASLADLRGKLGVFYVTGNHEYYYGGQVWESEVRRLGLTVLRNEHRIVERNGARLVVAGVPDYNAGSFVPEHTPDPAKALAGAPSDIPRLMLAHQPRSAHLVGNERVDLQLSGHTHGGQIFPFMFFVPLQQPVIAGLKTVDGVRVYTHRGSGYWGPPMRVGASAEVAEITLVPA
jgi:predicted MPP superfamily phosphohydrolase